MIAVLILAFCAYYSAGAGVARKQHRYDETDAYSGSGTAIVKESRQVPSPRYFACVPHRVASRSRSNNSQCGEIISRGERICLEAICDPFHRDTAMVPYGVSAFRCGRRHSSVAFRSRVLHKSALALCRTAHRVCLLPSLLHARDTKQVDTVKIYVESVVCDLPLDNKCQEILPRTLPINRRRGI